MGDQLALLGFFFFKQKTAYEMLRSLVGSEMCIRDSVQAACLVLLIQLFFFQLYVIPSESMVPEFMVKDLSLIHI